MSFSRAFVGTYKSTEQLDDVALLVRSTLRPTFTSRNTDKSQQRGKNIPYGQSIIEAQLLNKDKP